MFFSPETPPEQRSWPRRLINRWEVDRAVFFALSLRAWQLVGGAVSVVLISAFFTPEVQGYYYTFGALVALQSLFDLGLTTTVAAVASHEWAKLGLNERGEVVGDAAAQARLAALARMSAAWCGGASFLYCLGVGTLGLVFFWDNAEDRIAWAPPWIVLVLLGGGLLWMAPLASLVEGCNQVAVVNRYRFAQAVGANVAVWVSILAGAQLWTAVAAAGARWLGEAYLLVVRYGSFFRGLARVDSASTLVWRREVWPMQWRVAVAGAFGYIPFAFLTPVMFHYHGAEVAGRLGMSWTLAIVLQTAALAWVQTRAPLLGVLVARRDFRELDRVFFRVVAVSFAMLAVAALVFEVLVVLLHVLNVNLADRLLAPAPMGLFLLVILLQHIPLCQHIYFRAHKREPLLPMTVAACTAIGLLVWWLGSQYGPPGVATGYLTVIGLWVLPYQTFLFRRLRAEWRR